MAPPNSKCDLIDTYQFAFQLIESFVKSVIRTSNNLLQPQRIVDRPLISHIVQEQTASVLQLHS